MIINQENYELHRKKDNMNKAKYKGNMYNIYIQR